MIPIRMQIDSEIDHLRSVLVHRPGEEIVRMTQHELDLSLFDDILSPAETVREHDLMVEILRGAGAQTLDITDLLTQALGRASATARQQLLVAVCELAGARELAEILAGWSPERLALGLIGGIYWNEIGTETVSLGRIRSTLVDSDAMALRPTPNLMFMRDPCMAVGRYVVVGRMATAARAREPLLVSFALRESGYLKEAKLLFEQSDLERHALYRCLEGGDLLVLSSRVVLVGCSQRTSAQTIERLANESLFAACPELERIYAVIMPEHRSVMHLDTILTQIDERLFLGHQPMIGGSGSGALPAVRLERNKTPHLEKGASVLDVLRREVGPDIELVPCGGNDRLHQEREQWTDGANALTLAPGRIILYSRNVYTIAALQQQGFEEVRLHSVQPSEQRAELIAAGMERQRTVFSFSGSELSRARGGGRCLTMPLWRQRP